MLTKYTGTSSTAFLFASISSGALAVSATHLAWFWASLLLLSCGLHTSCPNRQRGSGWSLLVPAGWSRWACTEACWTLLGRETELLYTGLNQLPFLQKHSVCLLLTDMLVQCRGNITSSPGALHFAIAALLTPFCSPFVSHSTHSVQMWTKTAEPAVPPWVTPEGWLDFFFLIQM